MLTFEHWSAKKKIVVVRDSEAQNLVTRKWTSRALCLNSVAVSWPSVIKFKIEPLVNSKSKFLAFLYLDNGTFLDTRI